MNVNPTDPELRVPAHAVASTVADVQQWLGIGSIVLWLVVAVTVMLARLRRGERPPLVALITTGIAAVLFAAYSLFVDGVADPGPLAAADAPVLNWMIAQRDGGNLDKVMIEISNVGGTLGMSLLAAAGAAVLLWLRHIREATVVVVAGAGAAVLVEGFKALNARDRPPVATQLVYESSYALPSGHSLSSIVVIGILAVVAAAMLRSTLGRALVGVLAVAAVGAIGVSRLYLGVHWLTDVLAGWSLGGAWLALCIGALQVGDIRSPVTDVVHEVEAPP